MALHQHGYYDGAVHRIASVALLALLLPACRETCSLPVSCCASCEDVQPRVDSCGVCGPEETEAYRCPLRSSCAVSYYRGEGPSRCCRGSCESASIYSVQDLCEAADRYLHECAPESTCFQAHRAAAGGSTFMAWRRQESGTVVPLLAVWGDGVGRVWAAGMRGRVVRWQDGQFQDELTPTSEALTGLWGDSEGQVWAVGLNGVVLRRDSLAGWVAVDGATTADLQAVWGRASDEVWAVGDKGTIIHFDGTGWYPQNLPGDAGALRAIHGNSKELFALASDLGLFRFSAQRWLPEPSPEPKAGLSALFVDETGDLWLSALDGRMLHRAAGNGQWQRLLPDAGVSLLGVGAGAGERWALGRRGIVARLEASGWQRVSYVQDVLGLDLYAIWGDADQAWIVGDRGIVLNLRR